MESHSNRTTLFPIGEPAAAASAFKVVRIKLDTGPPRRFTGAALFAVVLAGWSVFLTRSPATGMGQDFTTMYVGALAWLGGHNPYSTSAPATIAAHLHIMQQGVINSPLLLLIDAPLTVLRPEQAFQIFTACQYALVALGGWSLTAGRPRTMKRLLVIALLACPATFLLGYYGQIGAIVFASTALGIRARRRQQWVALGICVACAAIKPQLGLCAAVPLLWGAPRKAWISAIAAGIALIAIMAVELSPAGLIAYVQALRAFDASPFVRTSSDALGLTSLYRGWLGSAWWPALTWAGAAIGAASALSLPRRHGWHPPEHALAMATYLGVLVLPYSHQYDAVAILPALYLARSAAPLTRGTRLLYHGGVAIMLVTPLMALSSHPYSYRLYPIGALACLIGLWIADRRAPCPHGQTVSGLES